MSGKLFTLVAQAGVVVEKGAPLLVLEAMKMEHTITAPADGTVEAIHAAVGDQVSEKHELIALK
jgi:3-methylcrotonyl-CoA carboxylase alpha subunit